MCSHLFWKHGGSHSSLLSNDHIVPWLPQNTQPLDLAISWLSYWIVSYLLVTLPRDCAFQWWTTSWSQLDRAVPTGNTSSSLDWIFYVCVATEASKKRQFYGVTTGIGTQMVGRAETYHSAAMGRCRGTNRNFCMFARRNNCMGIWWIDRLRCTLVDFGNPTCCGFDKQGFRTACENWEGQGCPQRRFQKVGAFAGITVVVVIWGAQWNGLRPRKHLPKDLWRNSAALAGLKKDEQIVKPFVSRRVWTQTPKCEN